jgi:tetratricopeptide (TPR) repeat protein
MRFSAGLLIAAAAAFAQQPGGDNMISMQAIAQGLGVTCEYCHAGRGAAQPSPKMEVARAMMAMTRDINEKIGAATGKPAADTTRVTCVTCHRGVTIPGQLSDIVTKTALREGPDAAVAQYRDLRSRYYGRQSYDFGEETLLSSAEQLIRIKPANAIPLLRLNLEFYPKSVRSYSAIAYAYTRSLNDQEAMTALEKALELEPENGMIRGQLEQLKSYHRGK